MVFVPKARRVKEVHAVEEFIVKVIRPHGDPPAFWVEDDRGELKLAFPFDGEQGKVFAEMIGTEGVTYHKACITESGEFGIEAEVLLGYDW